MLYEIITNKVVEVSKDYQLSKQDVSLYFEENITGDINKMLVVGYWICPFKYFYNKTTELFIASVTIKLLDSNNNIVSSKEKIIKRKSMDDYDCKFKHYYRDWMYIADYIKPTGKYTKVRMEVKFSTESGDIFVARLTGFTLRKCNYGTYIKINEAGKLEEYLNNNVSYNNEFKDTPDMKIEPLSNYILETKKDDKNRITGTYSILGSVNTNSYNSVSNINEKILPLIIVISIQKKRLNIIKNPHKQKMNLLQKV